MKKLLFFVWILFFLCSVSWASDGENSQKMLSADNCRCEIDNEKESEKDSKKNSVIEQQDCRTDEKKCKEFELDDDEYFTYNQCFFDKQYRKMKQFLCLTRRQENSMDDIYLNLKNDLEHLYFKYKEQKEYILAHLACDNSCLRENKKKISEYKSEAKEKYRDFKEEVEELLCKKQRKDFNKFLKEERKQINRLKKYCVVYKFPCVICEMR